MSQLTVLIEEIGPHGRELQRELPLGYLSAVLSGEGPETGLVALAPAQLKARFEKVSGKILLTGSTAVKVQGACKRCLAPAQRSVDVEFQLSLVRELSAPSGEEGEEPKKLRDEEGISGSFESGAVEEEVFDGHEIDLGAIVREQILLALPMDLVCSEDCKGLCTVCGHNLNESECGCERKPPDPRWAALKDIKL